MTTKLLILALALITDVIVPMAQARFLTLVVNISTKTNEFQIEAGEVAELKGFSLFIPNNAPYKLVVIKEGIEIELLIPPSQGSYALPGTVAPQHVIAGPARVRIVHLAPYEVASYCTFNVTPESFPPDRTILVPPGTNTVWVKMECSTDLLHWLPATNGVYGNQNVAKFFRVKLDPDP